MFETPPNGYFIRDLIVLHGLRKGCYVSKGFIIEPPDLSAAAPEHLNAFQDQLALVLACLHDKLRLQVQWFCDSDYRADLLRYNEQTKTATNVWTRRCRNERFSRYWQAMIDRRLRRQRLVLFFSRKIETSPSIIATAARQHSQYDALLQQMTTEFEHLQQILTNILSGARITPMNDADHYRHCTTFLNPSLGSRFEYDTLETYDPQLSIQQNCWHSEAQGIADTSGFWMDGYYHSLLVISRWPKLTHPGLVHRLTGLQLLDYNITVNIESLSARAEIGREEKAHDRLAGDLASEKRLSLLTAMEKKAKKIAALMQGHTLPFNVEYIIRAWDQTREGLAVKTAAIKNAINGMNGAQYLACALPTTARKLFYQSWPGCPWGRYSHRKLYAETRYLADVLPFSATFTGHLDQAEAIYEGTQRNLVGITTFSGSQGNETPQHAVLLGMSGAGKSVTVCDLLSQTEAFYDYTVIIEEGLSYEIYTRTVEPTARPIIIQPDGDLTINYLDTHGLPLTAEHLASAMALVAKIAGVSLDEDKQLAREAQIAKYLMLLYGDIFEEWSRRNADRLLDVARHACLLAKLKRTRPGYTMIDTFVDFRDRQRSDPDQATGRLSEISEEEALRFLKETDTRREVRNLAFAYFTPEEYPTHRMLQELLQLDASDGAAGDLATRLLPWCGDGNYGCLLDGMSNISLTGKIAHFELGYIPESAKLLRAVAGFLITNYTRQHIITMPRRLRKRNVYEEVARLLDIPGGEQIVKESYAQMRKFNCWNISIVQQYGRFKESRIRSAVFGNSRQFFLMRQNDRSDLDDMAADIGLTELTKHAILSYPLPDQQKGEKFAAFTYLHNDAQNPICGTAHNVASPEMLYLSGSSGAQFDERSRQLRESEDIISAIATATSEQQIAE
jgi:type IV secretion system protein TrbE